MCIITIFVCIVRNLKHRVRTRNSTRSPTLPLLATTAKMSSSAVPPAGPAEAENIVTTPAMELTDEQVMMDLFINQVQVQEEEEVVRETVNKLAEFKVDKPWKSKNVLTQPWQSSFRWKGTSPTI